MSSHHFVREGQEPALFILEPVQLAMAEPLLEWAPLVVITEDCVDDILLWGIKIDIVIARPENVDAMMLQLAEQAPVKILSAGASTLESAMIFLVNAGEPAVSILCQAFSEDVKNTLETFGPQIQITVRDNQTKWSLIESGKYRKWFQKGSLLYFFEQVLAKDLKANRMTGVYELLDDQWVDITTTKRFWIGESL
jgi:hypothetical protein